MSCAPVKEEFNYTVNYSSECFTMRWDSKEVEKRIVMSRGVQLTQNRPSSCLIDAQATRFIFGDVWYFSLHYTTLTVVFFKLRKIHFANLLI